MEKITVTKEFSHQDLWEHEVKVYVPGNYAVVERPSASGQVSRDCADVALAERWAKPAGKPKGAPARKGAKASPTPRRRGSRTGKAKTSS